MEDVQAAVGAIACLFGGLGGSLLGNAVGDPSFPSFEGGLAWSVLLLLISRPAVLQLNENGELNHAR